MSDSTPAVLPIERLNELIEGYWTTQVIRAAAQLQLPDLLEAQALLPEELARRAGAHAGSVVRLLRAMTTIGLCEVTQDGSYSLTEMGALLRSNATGGKRARALFTGSTLYRAFEHRCRVVPTGSSFTVIEALPR